MKMKTRTVKVVKQTVHEDPELEWNMIDDDGIPSLEEEIPDHQLIQTTHP